MDNDNLHFCWYNHLLQSQLETEHNQEKERDTGLNFQPIPATIKTKKVTSGVTTEFPSKSLNLYCWMEFLIPLKSKK